MTAVGGGARGWSPCDPLARLRVASAARCAAGLRRTLRARDPGHDGLPDFASNDYLGLSKDPRLIAGAINAARVWGAGAIAVTPHPDVAAVGKALANRCEGTAIVVTDAVFSVTGDLAAITELHRVARAHDALLLVDEAHAFGVVDPGGRGAVSAAGLSAEPDVVRTVTLSKSMARQGGAVLGAPEVIQTLIDTGRSFIFDTGIAPACVGAALAALDVLIASPELVCRARERASQLAGIARTLGLRTNRPDAAVVSVTIGAPEAAVAARDLCARHGVHVACFRPPSVPAGRSCLRLAVRPDLTDADLQRVGRALAAVRVHACKPQRAADGRN